MLPLELAFQDFNATEKISYLPDELLQVAKIRLKALELSLSDIGKMLEPPISRSGVNHRLKKISVIADTLRGKEKTGD